MLLTWDGFDVSYDDPETWRTSTEEPDVEDDEPTIHDGIFSLVERRTQAALDTTRIGMHVPYSADEEVDVDFEARRQALIQHFRYKFERNEIVWHKNV
jgi:hypothetical protein